MTGSRNLTLIGIATWAVVTFTSAGWMARTFLLSMRGAGWSAAMVVFVVAFVIATRPECALPKRLALAAVQSIAALGAMALLPHGPKMEPVLLVIVAGELGGLAPLAGMTWIAVQMAVIVALTWRIEGALAYTLSFLVFQLFAYFAVQIAHREAHARQALAAANAELKVTAGLLDISSRTEERLRIARDLHDLLGHHLTALSINLEVASHLADSNARPSIEKSQAITKQLLGDVRAVVSRLRADEPVDLASAINSLREVIVAPALHVEMENVAVSDPAVAQVALRAVQEIVTNAVRHSGAKNLWVRLASPDHTLEIEAHDDGSGTERIEFGNGLRGIRERVEGAGGTFEVASTRGKGFAVRIALPLNGGSEVSRSRGFEAAKGDNLATS